MRKVAIGLLLVVGAAGCGGEKEPAVPALSFQEAVDAGHDCGELFRIRNEYDPGSPLVERANETLFRIGCSSSSSSRADQGEDEAIGGFARPGRLTLSDEEIDRTVPSPQCLDAAAAAEERFDTATEQEFAVLVDGMFTRCSDAVEWFAAAREHPGAVGMKGGAWVDDLALQGYCEGSMETPVCQDAKERGIIPDSL